MRIGIFDSGVGGLTVAKEIAKKFLYDDIVYFGDSIHLPYGNKSKKNILRYSFANVEFLRKKKCEIIVVACNTSTAIAIEPLKKKFSFPIYGVIEGGVQEVLKQSKTLKIGVLGTTRTIISSAYKDKILECQPQAKVYQVASPLLVPIIEEGLKDKEIIKAIIRNYLDPIIGKIDSLILGCTHYPLLKPFIQKIYPQLIIVDSAKTTASLIMFKDKKLNEKKRKIEIITNDDNEIFHRIAKKIFPKEKVILQKERN